MSNNYKKIVTAQAILEKIKEDWAKKQELADHFECSVDKIGTLIKDLRTDGEAIIHSQNGLKAIDDKEEIENSEEFAKALENMIKWVMGTIYGVHTIMIPNKPLLPAMRRCLNAIGYNKAERKKLRDSCLKLGSALVMIEQLDSMDDE